MEVKQVYEFINSVSKQAFGKTAVTATDLTGLISMGDFVLNSDSTRDAFMNVLVDRIGKTVSGVRPYKRNQKSIIRNTFEFGAILQKINVDIFEAKKSETWELEDGATLGTWELSKPKAKQKLFGDRTAWQCDVSIPDIQIKSAFLNAEGMAAFISAIFVMMENSLEVQLEQYENMAYCNFIAEKIHYQATAGTGIHVVYLVQDYNSRFGKTITAANAFADQDFLKYSTQQVNLWLSRFEKMSKLFNTEEFARFTPRSEARLTMLSTFASAADSYLQSDTFHNEYVKLPYYTEIPYWQGSGQEYAAGEISTIDITTSSGNVVKQDGVIALISDIEAIGMVCDNRRTTSARDNNHEITTYFNKADIKYYNDMSENGLVFVVTDTPYTA